MNHAKTVPTSSLFYIKLHTTLKNTTDLQSFKLIIYSYSKIKTGSQTEPVLLNS